MDLELFNNTINLLKDGVEIKGSFSATPYGRTIEFKSPNEQLNKSLSGWFSEFEDKLYEAENYQSDSGEIELMIQQEYIYCKIEATIYDEYLEKHSKEELITPNFLKILSQYPSKDIVEHGTGNIEFNLLYESTKNDFATLEIIINENPVSLTKEHLNKVKDEFISVFNKWDDNYQGEDYDEIEKYIEYTYDGNEFDVTEYITIERGIEPEEV